MKEGGIKHKESGLEERTEDIKHPVSENVSLRRRIEFIEKPLFELREKVSSLESEIRKMREYIGMSE